MNFTEEKIKLSDGTSASIFSVEQRENSCHPNDIFINCLLCRIKKLPFENFQTHVKGKRHKKLLTSVPDAEKFRKPLLESETTQLVREDKKTQEEMRITSPAASMELKSYKPGEEKEEYGAEKFKIALDLELQNLFKDHKLYKRKPEAHPSYKTEWIKFWERRFNELKMEGKINPHDYDYESEWKVFWMKRMDEILAEAIEAKKRLKRQELRSSKKRSYSSEKSPNNETVSISEDSSEDEKFHRDRRTKRRHFSEVRQYQYRESGENSKRSLTKSPHIDDSEPVTFVSVCRLLSALETEITVFAPHVLDLLSKSLALERHKPNSSDVELMTEENVLFLETVKEKLKGLLIVNLVSPSKMTAVKKCIQNIAKLIHQTPVKSIVEKPRHSSKENDEKVRLAGEIAIALKNQGKEDCTQEELEILVEMFLEDQFKPDDVHVPEPTNLDRSSETFDGLDDEDIKLLLQRFSELESDEQTSLIKLLEKMEQREPERVEALRQFVNTNSVAGNDDVKQTPLEIDDDPDDYNFNETIENVVSRMQQNSSLTDNLLKICNYPRKKFQPN